jgi:CelD/BcsL family acetyltransferase involved in cellulose biosynthesis
MPELTLRELNSNERPAVATLWQDLERLHGQGGLTNSWDWTRCWLDAFGDLVPHVFLVGETQGEPVGIVLITQGVGQRRGPIPVRTVHIGTAGEPITDAISAGYHRILVRESCRQDFSVAIVRHVQKSSRRWEELVMYGFAPEDAHPFIDTGGFWHVRREICRVSDLNLIRENGGDVLASLGKTTRRNLRRSMRELGAITTEQATNVAEAKEILAELIDLHQRRWIAKGEPGAFAGDRFRAFHDLLVESLMDRNAIMMFRVRTENATIGCKYGFLERNRMISYQVGTADFEGRVNPGLLTNLMCIQHCLELGLEEFNLMPADMPYKQELTNSTRELLYPVLSRRTPKQLLLRYARNRRFGKSISVPAGSGNPEGEPS